ncbi:MAG: hypothetical protein RLO52_28500 [Sandaracinaceae bacterium]|nr:MAG: hypothetical protein EVA89_07575 [Sandaracinaceae bacterium]HBQ17383.1 hypothetical protein [Myxococcales bacterium]
MSSRVMLFHHDSEDAPTLVLSRDEVALEDVTLEAGPPALPFPLLRRKDDSPVFELLAANRTDRPRYLALR